VCHGIECYLALALYLWDWLCAATFQEALESVLHQGILTYHIIVERLVLLFCQLGGDRDRARSQTDGWMGREDGGKRTQIRSNWKA